MLSRSAGFAILKRIHDSQVKRRERTNVGKKDSVTRETILKPPIALSESLQTFDVIERNKFQNQSSSTMQETGINKVSNTLKLN